MGLLYVFFTIFTSDHTAIVKSGIVARQRLIIRKPSYRSGNVSYLPDLAPSDIATIVDMSKNVL